jgi:hypothetical protein
MFHSFTGALPKFLASVFDDGVSGALARVLTDGDYLAVCICLQGVPARVDLMRHFVRVSGHKF